MTNDERSSNREIRNGETEPVGVPFELRISVFPRHSSFGFRHYPEPARRRRGSLRSPMSKIAATTNCWITGAGGLIGNYLVKTAPRLAPDWNIRGLARAQLDLTVFNAVRQMFREQSPQLVIHCAALSRSQACQENPALARKLNLEVSACLAELAADVPLILFSSDLVFDGRTGNYDERAQPNPLSVYAETKIAAERTVLANPRHTVVRISLNGGASPTGDRGFNEEMRRAWLAGRTLRLFTDEFRCPMPAVATARAIWELAAQNRPGL